MYIDDENWYSDDEDEDNNSSSAGEYVINDINKNNPFWKSSEAADLFGFDHGADVYNELAQLIDTFQTVMNSRSDIRHLPTVVKVHGSFP